MRRLEEWPSSTEFGLQAVCHVAPGFPTKRAGAIIGAALRMKGLAPVVNTTIVW